jgi:hypothetical protein
MLLLAALAREAYERHKQRTAARQSELSVGGRELFPIPGIRDFSRRLEGLSSLERYCKLYRPTTFPLPWSPDHLRFIEQLEQRIRDGGLKAEAQPRGSGKTSLITAAAEWGILNGFRRFAVIVGATATKAGDILDSIRNNLESNEILADDFPEVCFPIRWLGGINQRKPTYLGRPVKMSFTLKEIQLPDLPGSPCGGSVIYCDGITSKGIRGLKRARSDGHEMRPDLCLLDDPQDDDSAKSMLLTQKRMGVINGTILGLAGPKTQIACLAAVTVIQKADLADQLLDREANPGWAGNRVKLMRSMPGSTNAERDKVIQGLWDEYHDVSRREQSGGLPAGSATEFYREHQAVMDEGAAPSWPERFRSHEISAIQMAMNLKFHNQAAFFAEFQNEPLSAEGDVPQLSPQVIVSRLNRERRGVVPESMTHLVFHIDVQDQVLFYEVKAGAPGFETAVVEYGNYPKQNRSYFAVREVTNTLAVKHPGLTWEAQLFAGLSTLIEDLCGRKWLKPSGAELRIGRGLIDAQNGRHKPIVYQVCARSRFGGIVIPSHGKGVRAPDTPITEWKRNPGEQVGDNWKILDGRDKQSHILYDTNYWKSFNCSRWLTNPGDPGATHLFGDHADLHRMYADHLTSEYPVRVSAKGRVVDEWQVNPSKPENHWLDTDVACMVALSSLGLRLDEIRVAAATRSRRHFSAKELRKR